MKNLEAMFYVRRAGAAWLIADIITVRAGVPA